jgi:hypothetical protein
VFFAREFFHTLSSVVNPQCFFILYFQGGCSMFSRKELAFVLGATLLVAGCGKKEEAAQSQTETPAAMQNPVDPATAATVTGVVKFSGKAPKAKTVDMAADAYCKAQHSDKVKTEEAVVNPNGTLKYVYVYVKGGLDPNLQFPVPAEPVVLDQQGCWYKPHVIAAQANQAITVRNSDGVLHNINAQPKNNQGFNFGQPVQGMENKKSFANPEVMIPVKCDVHPWMKSYVGVQNHPYAAVTGDDGAFSLANLPPGEYEIEAWHEIFGTATQKVTVGPKESKAVGFAFKGS